MIVSYIILGIIAGGIFFGGLRWTTTRLVTSRYPSLLALGSFMIRTLVTLSLFYWAITYSVLALVLAVLSFTFVRVAFVLYEKNNLTKVKGGIES